MTPSAPGSQQSSEHVERQGEPFAAAPDARTVVSAAPDRPTQERDDPTALLASQSQDRTRSDGTMDLDHRAADDATALGGSLAGPAGTVDDAVGTAAPPTGAGPGGGGTLEYVGPATRQPAEDAATLAPPTVAYPTVPTTGGTIDAIRRDGPPTIDPRPRKETDLRFGATRDGARAGADACPREVAGYEILGILGRGAMGVVYKARQRGLNRLVALKMILAGSHAAASEQHRFRIEAQAVARLQHPNIVQIYEIGEEEGRPFFSLEFVDGASLDKKVRGEPLPPQEAARLGQQLAEAMDYAHKNGIIHRDLKPANILMTSAGIPKIGDFGLAKRIEDDAGQTRTGTVLGTPSYMAPEQAEGKLDQVGPLSDVYSLGAILYDLLTGRAPFKGTTLLETLEQVRTREPVPPVQLQPGVPRDLETICLKCLQKDPARRYPSAVALAQDLGRFLKGEPILARPVSRVERLWRWAKRNPRIAWLSAGVILLVIAWGITASVMAWQINLQKDEIEVKKDEADRQTVIAEKKGTEAKENEKRAKETAERTVSQMVALGKTLHNRLQSKRLTIAATPEVRRLRDDLLVMLRNALTFVSLKVEAAGTTTYGRIATYQAMGDLLVSLGQSKEAHEVFVEGHRLAKKLADADPNNDQTRDNLGVMVARLGHVALDADGDARTARKHYLEARALHEATLKMPQRTREEWQCRVSIAHDDILVGRACLALGQADEARKYFGESLKHFQFWSGREPKSWEASNYVMEALMWLGTARGCLGDDSQAQKHFAEAVRIGKGLMKLYPWRAAFNRDMAEIQGNWGDAWLRLGKTTEAEKVYRDSEKNLQVVLKAMPDDLSQQPLLALTTERLARVAALQGNAAEAGKLYGDALKLREELLRLETNNLARKAAYLLALARAGQSTTAAGFAPKLRPKLSQSTELLLQLARCWAVCAGKDAANKAAFTANALEALEAATKADYKDAHVLETDPDLVALRTEPRFKAVIERVKTR
jgi:serine/threonine-protein kinase